MTAFTKFTASVAGLASACTLSLATPAFAAPDTHITDTQRPPPYCLTAAETKKARD